MFVAPCLGALLSVFESSYLLRTGGSGSRVGNYARAGMKNEDGMRILEMGPGESLKQQHRENREERTLKGGLSS